MDFQTSFYQAAALLTKGSRKASSLTDEDKTAFQLVFSVGPGSSEIEAKAGEKLTEILARVVDKMEAKHVAVAACLVLVLYFGKGGLEVYLNHAAENKKIEEQSQREKGLHDIIRGMTQAQRENIKVVLELSRRNEIAREITTGSIDAHDSIVRHSGGAESVRVNGREVCKNAINELRSNPRRTGSQEVFEGVYSIESVDPTDPRQYQIKLRNLSDGIVFMARLADAVAMSEFKQTIKEAEWGRSRVLLKISARKVGNSFRNAEILIARMLDHP